MECPYHPYRKSLPTLRYWHDGTFLPPYSPDMNPIEMAFSKAKAIAKANDPALEAGMDIEILILTGFASITTDGCKVWIFHAGYKLKRSK